MTSSDELTVNVGLRSAGKSNWVHENGTDGREEYVKGLVGGMWYILKKVYAYPADHKFAGIWMSEYYTEEVV